jgi:aryl-alcohol dehydrogenase-like predicted oxidoreductase
MRYRKLGRTGFEVSEIGHGAWGIGGGQWLGGTDDESVKALRASIAAGVNFIDTALAYNDGHSEKLVSQVVAESGEKVYIATKVPPKNRVWPARSGVGIEDVFPYAYIVDCTETSLRNLNTGTIDLQQLHVWNPEWLDRDEWKRAIEDLKKAGKVRAFGISINDHQPDSAIGIINTGFIDTVQVIYNIFDQTPEKNLFPLCLEKDIGVIARVPFDEGALTGFLCRCLGSRWFTERFHRNALVTHFQDNQVFCTARRLETTRSPAADFSNARPRGDTQLMWLRSRSTSSVPTMLTTRSVPAALA